MDKQEEILKSLEALTKAVHNGNLRTQRIEQKLIGDKEMEIPGLISEVEDLKNFKRKEELNRAKRTGIAVGVGVAGGGFGAWLKSLFGGG